MTYFEIIDINFIIIFFIILFLNIIILKYRFKIAQSLKIIDIPNERKIHKEPTPLIGGLGFFITLLILLFYYFVNNKINFDQFISLNCIYTTFFLVGLFDDIKTLSAKLRSFLIIISSIILILFNNEFLIQNLNFKSLHAIYDLKYFSYLFTLFCIFALYNAFNFIDGYNGSATSIILLWSIYLLIKNPTGFYFIFALISLLVFLYNLSGKIFLGNSGTSLISIFFFISHNRT